jgi:serine/threonine protein kinase
MRTRTPRRPTWCSNTWPASRCRTLPAPDTLLPVAQVLDIAFKCCNALEYAQREGLVHRDIKPANILRTDDGEVKLTDFGAALAVRSEATQLAGLVGSPSYMSPEQVREQDLTHHSDMFSLAVVVYELLTGRRPFDGDTDYATLYRISNEAPTPPSLLRASLPTRWTSAAARAGQTRKMRFATWDDFATPCWPLQPEPAPPALARHRSRALCPLACAAVFCRLSRRGAVGADAPGQLAPAGRKAPC